MTWKELKEWIEYNFDCAIDKGGSIFVGNIFFTKDGQFNFGDVFGGEQPIAENISYENMKKIMEALQ